MINNSKLVNNLVTVALASSRTVAIVIPLIERTLTRKHHVTLFMTDKNQIYKRSGGSECM